MKRPYVLLLLVAPTLYMVRAVVRHQREQAEFERTFGTDEERQRATDQLLAKQRSVEDAGRAAGLQQPEQGCLEMGFEQEKSGKREYSRLMKFLEGCLASAQPTPGFCDDVPPYRAVMSPPEEERSKAYQDALCRKHGFPDWQCGASVRVIQIHCHPLK